MVTVSSSTVVCSLCSKESTHSQLGSWSNFGYPDLDFRPSQMLRGTMEFWVQECPYCGYTRGCLSYSCQITKEEVDFLKQKITTDYDWSAQRARSSADLSSGNHPPAEIHLAKKFALSGAILAKAGNANDAATQFLRAAWIFDDVKDEERAKLWRLAAIEQADIFLQKTPSSAKGNIFCIRADMLRRTGQFQRVLDLNTSGYRLKSEEYNQIFFQKALATHPDCKAYSLGEMLAKSRVLTINEMFDKKAFQSCQI